MARAALNISRGRDLQGGSTITQQYVKLMYLTQERTVSRKFKELFISIKLSKSDNKSQDPRGLPQHDLLRPWRVRRPGRRARRSTASRTEGPDDRRVGVAGDDPEQSEAVQSRPAGEQEADPGAVPLRARRHAADGHYHCRGRRRAGEEVPGADQGRRRTTSTRDRTGSCSRWRRSGCRPRPGSARRRSPAAACACSPRSTPALQDKAVAAVQGEEQPEEEDDKKVPLNVGIASVRPRHRRAGRDVRRAGLPEEASSTTPTAARSRARPSSRSRWPRGCRTASR